MTLSLESNDVGLQSQLQLNKQRQSHPHAMLFELLHPHGAVGDFQVLDC
jgi:hypothetical protein